MATINRKLPETGRSDGLAEFTRLFRLMVDPYRPELHYMRGPGPKTRARQRRERQQAKGNNAKLSSRASS